MMKKLLRIVLFFTGLFFLLTLTGAILVSAYKEDIQKYILGYLNDRINTKVNVRKVHIGMLRHFPYISATFQDVTVLSSSGYRRMKISPDTLLSANEVVLDINIYNALIKKDIRIDRILISGGSLNFAEEKNGKNNWSILKKNGDGKSRKVQVPYFLLEGMNYRYENKKENIFVKGKINKGLWSESFWLKKQGYRILLQQEGLVLNSKGKDDERWKGKTEISGMLYPGDDSLVIRKGKIRVETLPEINFNGAIVRGKEMEAVVHLSAGGIEPDKVIPWLVKEKPGSKGLRPGGELSVRGSVHIAGPHSWQAAFNLEGGKHHFSLKKKTGEIRILQWKGRGSVRASRGRISAGIIVSPVKIKYGNSTLTGTVEWKNEKRKPVIVSLKGPMDLKDADVLLGGNKIFLEGMAVMDLKINVPQSFLKKTGKEDWKKIGINGSLTLHNFKVLLPGPLQAREARVEFLPGHLLGISGENIRGAGTQWKIKGTVYRLDDFIEKKGVPLVIKGELQSSHADLEDVIRFFRKSDTGDDEYSNYGGEKPSVPVITAKFRVDTFRYQDLDVYSLKGALVYHDPVLNMKDLAFRTLGGDITGQMDLRFLQEGKLQLSTYGEMERVNVNALFRSFHDFDQKFIRAENLKGRISGNIAFQAEFDSTGRVEPATILSDSYLKLEQGELINFEPLYKLSKFIRLSELKNIRFTSLENEIFIMDSRVIIPEMKVSSSAVDLDIAGSHYFDNHFEYHIRVYLSDFLARKVRKTNQDNGLGLVEEPGERNTSLFLIYRGDAGSSKISYDKKRTRQKISESLKKEKEELKALFREGKQKKDTLEILQEKEGEKTFRVVWPEEEQKRDTTAKKGVDTSSGKKFRVIWEEEPDTFPKKKDKYR